MTTVLFIHGTGVRERAFATTYDRIEKGLAKVRPDIRVERCYWGEIGARLQADGKSFFFDPPEPGETRSAEEASGCARGRDGVPEEEKELARWARLFEDPLFEIRLRQIAKPASVNPFGRPLPERVLELPGKPEVAAELASSGLTDAFAAAVQWVVSSGEFVSVFGSSAVQDGITEAMISRALVARCLAAVAADGVELTGEERDRLCSAVIAGFGAPDYTIADDLGDLAKNLAFRAGEPWLRHRRRTFIRESGDILLYQARGGAIRGFVRRRIQKMAGPVVLLAHSLGGIVAFDLLAGSHPAGSHPARSHPAGLEQVRMLVTVGSQVPLLYELGALSCGLSYPMALPETFLPRWVNVYDRRDLLAYAGAELFGRRCHDIPLDTGTPFPTAHGAYWGKDALYQRLATVMQTEGL